MKPKKYTPAEIDLAKEFFAEAELRGTLKRPRAIAYLALSTGGRSALNASSVTYRDYLADARRALAGKTET